MKRVSLRKTDCRRIGFVLGCLLCQLLFLGNVGTAAEPVKKKSEQPNKAQPNKTVKFDVDAVLARMEEDGRHGFDPATLRQAGVEGLSKLLDVLLPQTAKKKKVISKYTKAQILQLIAQLHSAKFKVRENATKELLQHGRVHRPLFEQAIKTAPAETRLRAKKILRSWTEADEEESDFDTRRYTPAFSVYLKCKWTREMYSELSRRMVTALKVPSRLKGQRQFLANCLRKLVKTQHDPLTDPLIPLLKHPNENHAVWVTEMIGRGTGERCYPTFLLKALMCGREPIVDMALDWSSVCSEQKKRPHLKRCLLAIFRGKNKKLKIACCRSLIKNFDNAEAIDYLLDQIQFPNKYQDIGTIANSCGYRRKAFPKLLIRLVPFLKSKDLSVRRTTIYALGRFDGPQVIDALISSFGDTAKIVRQEARQQLYDQKDRKILIAKLATTVKNSQNSLVKIEAKKLLDILTSKPKTLPKKEIK